MFPSAAGDPFFWGVATSAYQSEGGYNGPGQPQTNWAPAERAGQVAPLGRAADFLERYAADFVTCRELGLNAFRLGWEWCRCQPQAPTADNPGWDEAALRQYASMTARCQAEGLEPIVTLQHFVHPLWLGVDGWHNPASVEAFAAWATKAVTFINRCLVEELGARPVHWYVTLNEPNMLVTNTYFGRQFPSEAPAGFASIWRATNHLLCAHIRAYNAIHDVYLRHGWPAPRVTTNLYCFDLYWSDKFFLDLLLLRERRVARHDFVAHFHGQARAHKQELKKNGPRLHRDLPWFYSKIVARICEEIGYQQVKLSNFTTFLDELDRSPRASVVDYLGLDYYDPFAAHSFRLPVLYDHEFRSKSFRSWVMASFSSKWWDWRVLPPGLAFFCEYYSRTSGKPIFIMENGMALRRRPDNAAFRRPDKMSRSEFLRLHVREVEHCLARGVPILGYLHWSLFDNYEWGTYTPRFGLFSLDYAVGTERLPEDHHGDRPAETYAALVANARRHRREGVSGLTPPPFRTLSS